MADIIVLTNEAKLVLQDLVFNRINELRDTNPKATELDTLHRIYSDVVTTKR